MIPSRHQPLLYQHWCTDHRFKWTTALPRLEFSFAPVSKHIFFKNKLQLQCSWTIEMCSQLSCCPSCRIEERHHKLQNIKWDFCIMDAFWDHTLISVDWMDWMRERIGVIVLCWSSIFRRLLLRQVHVSIFHLSKLLSMKFFLGL